MGSRIFGFLLAVGLLHGASIRSYETLAPGEKVVAKGVVYYSEPMRFDYDRDGKLDNVVMAAKFFIKKTPKGYRGYLVRGLYDFDRKKALAYYADSLIMHPPANTYIAVSNVRVEGKKVTFRSGPFAYTFVDGGPGIANDSAVVHLRSQSKKLRLYGGDVIVYTNPKGSRAAKG